MWSIYSYFRFIFMFYHMFGWQSKYCTNKWNSWWMKLFVIISNKSSFLFTKKKFFYSFKSVYNILFFHWKILISNACKTQKLLNNQLTNMVHVYVHLLFPPFYVCLSFNFCFQYWTQYHCSNMPRILQWINTGLSTKYRGRFWTLK